MKQLIGAVLFGLATVTPSFAQIFWTNQSPSGVTDDIWCVTYANGTFAAVTDQGNLLTSTNGLNWSSQAVDPGVWLESIAYGNGTWVVVGDKGTILVSSDLKTWVHANSFHADSVTGAKLNGVLYDGMIWVAVGEAGTIVTSSDALNCELQPEISGVTGFLHGITCDPVTGSTVISGQNGVLIVLNSNTGVPDLIASRSTQNLESVLCEEASPGGTVAVGANGTIEYNSQVPSPDPPQFNSFSLSFFYKMWTSVSVPNTTATFRGLAFGNGYWVAAGEQGTILTSADGPTWTQRFSGDSPSTVTTATLLSATYSKPLQRFVITGSGGTILVSNAAPTVFGNVSTRAYVSSNQTFIGGFVIEGTAQRTVLIRADGPVLSQFSVPSPLPDPVLTVYNSSGAVVATNTGWTTNTRPSAISSASQQTGAFALPNPSADSALLLTLPPGAYTAQITSAKGNSGTALFEAYTN